jgi:CHAT domain-containing protein
VTSLRAKKDAESQAFLDTLYSIAAARSKISFGKYDGSALAANTKLLKDLERSRDRQQLKLFQMSETLQGGSDKKLTLAQVQERMGERDVLIEWTRVNPFDISYLANHGNGRMWGDARYVAFIIVRDQAPEVVDLGPASEIEPIVMRLLTQLRTPTSLFDPTDAKLLFNLVVKPWLAPMAKLRKQVDQLLLAPDGALNTIPFAALMDDEGRYFGERHILNYLTSGRDLLRLQNATKIDTEWQERIMVIAAPNYDAADKISKIRDKLIYKRAGRDATEIKKIATENNQLTLEATNAEQAKKIDRLKKLGADKKAGKEIDPAEAKQLLKELQAPMLASIMQSLSSKLQQTDKITDRTIAEYDADESAEADATRRQDHPIAQNADSIPRSSNSTDSRTSTQRPFSFKFLPGALAEGNLLVQIADLNPVQIFSETEATEGLLKNIHGPRILHIATHGFFLPPEQDNKPNASAPSRSTRSVESDDADAIKMGIQRNPMLRSGIALAGANRGLGGDDEDGILTAEELAQVDLRGTELVVLSACETGTGDVTSSEGVFGLRRALMLAGSRSQLVSLWRISDQGTSLLMSEYYRALKSGVGRARSLQLAQDKLRHSASTSHPYYWAAFIPLGDWRPIAGF